MCKGKCNEFITLCPTTRSGVRVRGKNAEGQPVLQVPAPSAAVGNIIGLGGSMITKIMRPLANMGNVHGIQKIPKERHSGDVWFVLDADVHRACVAAHEIENLIIR